MMNWKTATRVFFAVTMIAVGLIGLIGGAFAPIWRPVPETTPARELLAHLCDLISIVCGAGLLIKRAAAPAALVLLLYTAVWAAFFKGPYVIRAPLVEGSYQSIGENGVWIAAAWVLYCELARRSKFPAGDIGLRFAYLLYGLSLIAFGFSHFVYLELTVPLVPSWLPAPAFWAYLTGAIYLVTGVAIATGLAARVGTLGAAANITAITLLVWVPMILAGGMTAMHVQETVVSWVLMASAWVLASGSPPGRAALRAPSR